MSLRDEFTKELVNLLSQHYPSDIKANKAQFITSFYSDNKLIAKVKNSTLEESATKTK